MIRTRPRTKACRRGGAVDPRAQRFERSEVQVNDLLTIGVFIKRMKTLSDETLERGAQECWLPHVPGPGVYVNMLEALAHGHHYAPAAAITLRAGPHQGTRITQAQAARVKTQLKRDLQIALLMAGIATLAPPG